MNIAVCVKQVPDTTNVKVDPKTNNLVREGVMSIINPFDLEALEWALRLRDQSGSGKVTVISMGPPQAEGMLQECLNMGADEAFLLSDRAVAGADTLATGYMLSEIIKTVPYDYVFCGSEAIDGCTGQVGPIIAEKLGLAQFTYVMDAAIENGVLKVTKNIGRYLQMCRTDKKAVVCFLKGLVVPRPQKETDKRPKVVTIEAFPEADASRVGSAGSPTKVVGIQMSASNQSCYIAIDDSLSAGQRIKMIISGGIPQKERPPLIRGTAEALAQKLLGLPEVQKYI